VLVNGKYKISFSIFFFHFFCRCPPQEVGEANSKVPHVLTCYTILHRHRTAARQEFYAKIVQSLHYLKSLSENSAKYSRAWNGFQKKMEGEV